MMAGHEASHQDQLMRMMGAWWPWHAQPVARLRSKPKLNDTHGCGPGGRAKPNDAHDALSWLWQARKQNKPRPNDAHDAHLVLMGVS